MKKLTSKTLLKTPLGVQCEVGRSIKTVKEIIEYKKGTIIKLEQSEKNVIQLIANGKLYARGTAMRKDGEMYIKITGLERK